MQPRPQALVGVFEKRALAEQAIDELNHAGFGDDEVGIVTGEHPDAKREDYDTRREAVAPARTSATVQNDAATRGATLGAATGGGIGALAGIGAVAAGLIPGVGPVLSGGLLAALVGGATGAALGTFAGPFVALGLSTDEARHCERALGDSRTIVVVKPGHRTAEAAEILHRNGAHPRLPAASSDFAG